MTLQTGYGMKSDGCQSPISNWMTSSPPKEFKRIKEKVLELSREEC